MTLRPTQPRTAEQLASDVVGSLGAPRFEDVVVPRTTVAGKMRIVTRAELSAIRAETREYLVTKGFPVDATAASALGAKDEWDAELAVRTLALAVRDAKNTDRALAPLEDWRECDDDQVEALYSKYLDFRERVDPLAEEVRLGAAAYEAITAAAKKKDWALLMSFGSPALASFAITSVGQPASSPTPTS